MSIKDWWLATLRDLWRANGGQYCTPVPAAARDTEGER